MFSESGRVAFGVPAKVGVVPLDPEDGREVTSKPGEGGTMPLKGPPPTWKGSPCLLAVDWGLVGGVRPDLKGRLTNGGSIDAGERLSSDRKDRESIQRQHCGRGDVERIVGQGSWGERGADTQIFIRFETRTPHTNAGSEPEQRAQRRREVESRNCHKPQTQWTDSQSCSCQREQKILE